MLPFQKFKKNPSSNTLPHWVWTPGSKKSQKKPERGLTFKKKRDKLVNARLRAKA
jgi:hypothetical protein